MEELNTLPDVNKEMIKLVGQMKIVNEQLAALEGQYSEQRAKTDQAKNRAFLMADGAMEMRKQLAEEASWSAGEADVRALEAAIKSRKHDLDQIREELDTVGKIGSNIKAEMRAFEAPF